MRTLIGTLILPAVLAALWSCSTPAIGPQCAPDTPRFGLAGPSDQNMDAGKLVALTEWVRESKLPILSLLISRGNKLVYELYTSNIDRERAHYMMSVTKSVTSALVGAAVDRGLLPGLDAPLTDVLPKSAFPDEATATRFQALTLTRVMGMSALDAPVVPSSSAPGALARMLAFFRAKNRLAFALGEKLLPRPGTDFLYSDVTPMLASGAVQYAAKKTLLDFADETLFKPMDFHNTEWMHEDPAGFDNGAFGLRLRPIDMQKFGILFLNGGCWDGKRLLSTAWVERSFTPWIRSGYSHGDLDYGWFWWHDNAPGGWSSHIAAGHRGQRIMIFPEKGLVVTMTSLFKNDAEVAPVIHKLFREFIGPAVEKRPERPASQVRLQEVLKGIRSENRIPKDEERRMIPSEQAYEKHRPFVL